MPQHLVQVGGCTGARLAGPTKAAGTATRSLASTGATLGVPCGSWTPAASSRTMPQIGGTGRVWIWTAAVALTALMAASPAALAPCNTIAPLPAARQLLTTQIAERLSNQRKC
ncbi:hypothetical protein HaLaN_00541 [Haematococcus lacustris]|uniref:Uncharacterized protein n=1 Tax=Haematococcus lacustris TaxID=44745 RepID=A0A699YG33_HAELA|nr:hypothetical protein HaLaN_00541 [Haematococcus lacustris]